MVAGSLAVRITFCCESYVPPIGEAVVTGGAGSEVVKLQE